MADVCGEQQRAKSHDDKGVHGRASSEQAYTPQTIDEPDAILYTSSF